MIKFTEHNRKIQERKFTEICSNLCVSPFTHVAYEKSQINYLPASKEEEEKKTEKER